MPTCTKVQICCWFCRAEPARVPLAAHAEAWSMSSVVTETSQSGWWLTGHLGQIPARAEQVDTRQAVKWHHQPLFRQGQCHWWRKLLYLSITMEWEYNCVYTFVMASPHCWIFISRGCISSFSWPYTSWLKQTLNIRALNSAQSSHRIEKLSDATKNLGNHWASGLGT